MSARAFAALALLPALVFAQRCAKDPSEGTQAPVHEQGPVDPESTAPSATTAQAAVDPEPAEPEPEPEPEPPEPLPDDYLQFAGACGEGPVVTLTAVGDVLMHHELQKQAYADSKLGFRPIWAGVQDLFEKADISYANLESPLASGIGRDFKLAEDPGESYDKHVYSGYPRFNVHPRLARDLKRSGIDVVSTANNHALDRGALGVDRTLEALKKVGLRSTGTRPMAKPDAKWSTWTDAGDLRVAWVACTMSTNRVPDTGHQVLRCDKDAKELRNLVRRLARNERIDAVIVTPHWGKEYVHEPRDKDRERARRWIEAGATAVIGSHPHVLQPWEKVDTEDGREGLVVYSLGNFASHQPELPRRSSIVLTLGLRKTENGVSIVGVRYVPTHVRRDGDSFFVEAVDRVSGAQESRTQGAEVLGWAHAATPDEAFELEPHCDRSWRPQKTP